MQGKAKKRKAPEVKETSSRVTTWRALPDDLRILGQLQQKLGLLPSHVIRLAIHKLADAEGLGKRF